MDNIDKEKIKTGFKSGIFEQMTGYTDDGKSVWFDYQYGYITDKSYWSVEGTNIPVSRDTGKRIKAFVRFDGALNLFLKHTNADNIDISLDESYGTGLGADDSFINATDLEWLDIEDLK